MATIGAFHKQDDGSFSGAIRTLADLAGRIVDQGVGDQGGVFGEVQAVWIEPRHRIEAGGGEPADLERIKHQDRPEQ